MFADINGGLLDRRLFKEKAVICIFIQRYVAGSSVTPVPKQSTIGIASISIAVSQDRRRSLSMRPNQDQLTVLLQRYNLDVRITCSGQKNCSGINFKHLSKDPRKDVMN